VGNAEEFIGLYHKLWDYLRQTTDSDHSTDFDELVDKAAKMNGVFKNEAQRIKDFGKLGDGIRNHSFYQIVEVTPKALSEFKRLVDNIISPKNLIPTFQAEIECFTPKDKLVTALRYMQDKDFSQVVLKEKGKLSLLTAEGVAKWLEQQADKDVITVAKVKVGEALACDLPDTYEVMGPEDTIYNAQQAFKNSIDKKRPRLYAVIITDNGGRTGKPLGIVTPWDLTPVETPCENYVFCKQEDFWNIVFEGKSILLKDNKGLHYIACLLSKPERECHVFDLLAEVEGIPAEATKDDYSTMSQQQIEKEYNLTCSFPDDAGDILDSQAKKEIQEKMRGLREDLAEAERHNDLGLVSKYREEIESLESYISEAYSTKKGRSRKAADPADKARKAVSNSISRSLKKIEHDHPSLWRHLNKAIQTGVFCSYNPESSIDWTL